MPKLYRGIIYLNYSLTDELDIEQCTYSSVIEIDLPEQYYVNFNWIDNDTIQIVYNSQADYILLMSHNKDIITGHMRGFYEGLRASARYSLENKMKLIHKLQEGQSDESSEN